MNTFFIHFRKPLLIMTIIVVLIFQGYWLWSNYQSKKEELMERVKSETVQILLANMYNEPKIAEALKKQKVSKADIIITQNFQKPEIIKNGKVKYSNKDLFFKGKALDSVLYYSLEKSLNKNIEINVYYENKKETRTYPKNLEITDVGTTQPINTLTSDNSTYRIHIPNMRTTVISEIKGVINFSILYVILFFVTLFVLFRNLSFSQKLLKNKEVFTRNMTHELKIPISTILIAAEGLEKYNIITEPESVKKYARTIQRSSHQLSTLVESILQHARADNSNEKLVLTRVNLLSLLDDVRETLSGIITKKEANIIFENVNESIEIKGNYEQLKQIFLNLIDNSLKYSENQPIITITVEKVNHNLLIKIKDNGIGISKKYTSEIFKPYFRITNDDTHDVKGFGLGLSFVKNSLKNQNGNIRILKPESEGTTMEIKIPSYE